VRSPIPDARLAGGPCSSSRPLSRGTCRPAEQPAQQGSRSAPLGLPVASVCLLRAPVVAGQLVCSFSSELYAGVGVVHRSSLEPGSMTSVGASWPAGAGSGACAGQALERSPPLAPPFADVFASRCRSLPLALRPSLAQRSTQRRNRRNRKCANKCGGNSRADLSAVRATASSCFVPTAVPPPLGVGSGNGEGDRWVAFAWSCYLASFLACAPPSEGCRRPVSENARRRHGPGPGSREGLEAGEVGTTDDSDRRIDADVGHLGKDRSEILVKMQALFSKKASEYSRGISEVAWYRGYESGVPSRQPAPDVGLGG
jgi:hypothetical protein